MFNAPSNLPSDIAELQAMIALQNEKLSIFAAEIQERDYRIEKLKHELAGLRRHRFGSRSEALDQLELTLEEEEIARAATTPPVEDDKANQTNGEKRKPRRKPLPEHLHRNDQVLSPGDECSACGGSMKTLGEDIEDGLIDVIVVYKIDRLSRSLMDFARLVEIFDRHSVTFVSVTQSFNTTTSMGRLTLNILLSFAQFEREVIGERIRDKVAASRKRGMWMGGWAPMGYDVKDRKLVINQTEAATVRQIFERFVELGSRRLQRWHRGGQGHLAVPRSRHPSRIPRPGPGPLHGHHRWRLHGTAAGLRRSHSDRYQPAHPRPARHLRHLGWHGHRRQARRARTALRSDQDRHQVDQPGIPDL